MQMRKAARVLPEPVGAEIRVGRAARMAGQPSICGSVAEPKRERNHSWMMGWAHASASAGVAGGADCIPVLYRWTSCFIRPDIDAAGRDAGRPPSVGSGSSAAVHVGLLLKLQGWRREGSPQIVVVDERCQSSAVAAEG